MIDQRQPGRDAAQAGITSRSGYPVPMPDPRLYTDLAHLWPRLSPPQDYAPEADAIRHILLDHGLTLDPRCALIEFGAGGGHTLHHLRHDFDCVAVDLAPAMLEQCRRLNPDVETIVGDMRTTRLNQTFDAVLIHDAIDYLTTPKTTSAPPSPPRRHT